MALYGGIGIYFGGRLMEKKEEVDVTDVVSLMNVAHEACENWFSLIPGQDVEEAVAAVMAENAK